MSWRLDSAVARGHVTSSRRLNIILFGPSGVSKAKAGEAFINVCTALMPGVTAQYLDVRDALRDSTHVLLKRSQKKQREAVADAIAGISRRLRDAQLNVVGLHACHLCGSIPIFPCTSESFASLSPSIALTLIDDVYTCRQRLEAGGYPYRFQQLLNWRQIECGIADALSDVCKVENVYIAAKHPRITLYRLIFEPRRPRLYSASQITAARDDPEKVQEIQTHRQLLHAEYVVFDPLTVDDRILVNPLSSSSSVGNKEHFEVPLAARWPVDLSNIGPHYAGLVAEDPGLFPLTVNVGEAAALNEPDQMSSFRSSIDAQITARDFRYIDQADVIAAYRPRLGGHESRGVAAEKTYAAGSGAKPVVEYSPAEDTVTTESRPFSTPLPGPVCTELADFYDKLQAEARREAERRYGRNKNYYSRFEEFQSAFSA